MSMSKLNTSNSIEDASQYDTTEDSHSSTSKSATSRTSVKTLYWIIKKFNEVKKQCVRDIGFGGTLELPLWNSISRIFSTWLLGKVDCTTCAIVVDAFRKLPFLPEDVNRTFGVPCGPRDVLGPDTKISETSLPHIREQAGIPDKISLKEAEKIVLMELTEESTVEEKDSFKMAYVIIVMGHLLSPSMKYDHVNVDFLAALRCTDLIGQYNWCAYIIKGIIEAAKKVQDDMAINKVITNIAGCHIFLQIHYLDNLLLGPLQPNKTIFPRCKEFPTEVLNKLTNADTVPIGGYGANKFNARATVVVPTTSMSHPQKLPLIPSSVSAAQVMCNVPANSGTNAPISAATLPQFLQEKYPALSNTKLGNASKQYNASMTRAMNERHMSEKNILQQNIWLADQVFGLVSSRPSQLEPSISDAQTQASGNSSVNRGTRKEDVQIDSEVRRQHN